MFLCRLSVVVVCVLVVQSCVFCCDLFVCFVLRVVGWLVCCNWLVVCCLFVCLFVCLWIVGL